MLFNLGIYNGSKGTVIGFAFCGIPPTDHIPTPSHFHTMPEREIPTVLVKMDIAIGYSVSKDIENIIPFVAICSADKYGKNYHRWQLPLEPAFACTTHKMQGTTAKHGAVILPSANKPFARGLDYVAPSRPTELKKLFLLRPLTTAHFTSHKQEIIAIDQEYARLNSLHS
jgi:hypothetical protein